MGGAGAVVAEGQEARPPADVGPATADRRHTVPGPHRCPVAGHARRVRTLGRVYDLFRRWQRDGTWHRIFTALQARADAKELITWDLNVDSTIVRAHQHAASARKKGSSNRNRLAVSPASRTTTG